MQITNSSPRSVEPIYVQPILSDVVNDQVTIADKAIEQVVKLCGDQAPSYRHNVRRKVRQWWSKYENTNFAPAFTIWVSHSREYEFGSCKSSSLRVRPWAASHVAAGHDLYRIAVYFRGWDPDLDRWTEVCVNVKRIDDAEEWFR